MKSADLKVGMEVAIGPPSMSWGVKRAVVIGFGWEGTRYGSFRFRPTRDGKGGIAVAVLTQPFRFSRDGVVETWEPDVVRAQQIRGPWAEIKAQKDRADAAEKAERLREYDRREALDARRDAVEARLTELEGETVSLFHDHGRTGRVVVSLDILERLLDTIREFSDDPSVTGVR